ncbi:MAG: Asp-tRNA(Asn)/Glu-tRNA(Gln) amidotransferase GatCAB subunit B, partial [Alphaproteobacteria bacterium]|nr:Asp-tRNA(Asn)/Glu-tRNA(Gln) amidotransferase GatCAB subunit B [Alphaproteobacteria bacterium]
VADRDTADYFEEMLRAGAEAKAAANWLSNEYFGRLNRAGLDIASGPITAAANSAIVQMVAANEISGKTAKDLADILWIEQGDPRRIVEERGLKQLSDEGAIERAVDEVIAANPDKFAELRSKPKLAGWFVGQVMKSTGGKANPNVVNRILQTRLESPGSG